MRTDPDARRPNSSGPAEVDGPVTARLPARTAWPVGSYDASGDLPTVGGVDVAEWPGLPRVEIGCYAGADAGHRLRGGPATTSTLAVPEHTVRLELVTITPDVSARRRRAASGRANGSAGHPIAGRTLDADSRSWLQRLHAPEPIRGQAIADLYERLRREAAFHVRQRVAHVAEFPRSDIDDLATQAAGDALIALLRKLEEYRGDSHFLTWARRFAALEAPASIRRRLGRDRIGISRDPERAHDVADPGHSPQSCAELHELLEKVGQIMRDELTSRQRTVLTEVAINGATAAAVAEDLDTTPGAIYKSLHDARLKVRRLTTQLDPIG